jgi:hypothetical protein
MSAKSKYEHRGWKIRITGNTVGTGSSAMIEVWEPGQDPQNDAGLLVPFHKRVPTEPQAQAVALEAAKKWIDRQASGGAPKDQAK